MKINDIRENDQLDKILKNMKADAERDAQKRSPDASKQERRKKAVADIRSKTEQFLNSNPESDYDQLKSFAEKLKSHYDSRDADLIDSITMSMFHKFHEKPSSVSPEEVWKSYGDSRARGEHTSKGGWTGD